MAMEDISLGEQLKIQTLSKDKSSSQTHSATNKSATDAPGVAGMKREQRTIHQAGHSSCCKRYLCTSFHALFPLPDSAITLSRWHTSSPAARIRLASSCPFFHDSEPWRSQSKPYVPRCWRFRWTPQLSSRRLSFARIRPSVRTEPEDRSTLKSFVKNFSCTSRCQGQR